MQDSQDGRIDPSAWDGADDTDPAIRAGGYLMFEERCSGRIDPRNDEPIDFVLADVDHAAVASHAAFMCGADRLPPGGQ